MKKIPLILVILTTICFLPHVAASPAAQIQENSGSYIDAAGYLHIVGEVLNTGDVWLQFIKITGTLKDQNGAIVDVIFTYTTADALPPNQKSPFDLIESDTTRSSQVRSSTMVVEFREITTVPENRLAIEGANGFTDSLGNLNVVGQVRNNGSGTSQFTKIIATFYDRGGRVIYVDFAYTSPSDIPTGQAFGFKIIGPPTPISGQVANYALFAESHQYTSIPETPWPFIVLAAALTLGVVAVRKKKRPGGSVTVTKSLVCWLIPTCRCGSHSSV